ncbi:hypothetical protein KGY14_12635 [Ameyamaea chiangmaiensis]|uniref:Uncharacterized protein n=1 Tax=Ameyamaea chiangmaiensis TaxID=442969 RepID=A0A850PCT0_9PROT|nr:hypothetical protein [Ameyamaea chiangmaiensis]MBS4076036.1 hypothetical protein [Ameyamaea chiangmaiensis]NVN40096.1 hypothetical protein [Ameyamaea chiangmaiensis]
MLFTIIIIIARHGCGEHFVHHLHHLARGFAPLTPRKGKKKKEKDMEKLKYDIYGNAILEGYKRGPSFKDNDDVCWHDTGERTEDGDEIYINEDGEKMI